MRALRAQADKHAYASEMKKTIEMEQNLTLRQGIVEKLIVEDGICKGVVTATGARYQSKIGDHYCWNCATWGNYYW